MKWLMLLLHTKTYLYTIYTYIVSIQNAALLTLISYNYQLTAYCYI